MYLYVLPVRTNYISLDIRLLNTLMYQIGLCYTNS